MSRAARWSLAAFLIIVLAAGAAVWTIAERLQAPYKGYAGDEQFVDLPRGMRPQAIGRALVDAGVVSDTLVYRIALWQSGSARQLQAGEYRFDRAMTAREVIDRIARGDVFTKPITFPEGLTIREMAEAFEARGFGPAASFVTAAKSAGLVSDLDPAASDLEGYLFPATYALSRHASADQLVEMMVVRFRSVVAPDLAREAAARGLTMRQVVTLASIVEKETSRLDERPIIAAVYLKRLGIRMPLQSDPTVIYALQRAGRYKGNLTKDNLAFDSPYNTYRHAGLPPGPIAAPGRTALEAVVRAPETDYLYFVSRNDGTHVFARDLQEHNRNVQRYQVQFFRDKAAADARIRRAPAPPPAVPNRARRSSVRPTSVSRATPRSTRALGHG